MIGHFGTDNERERVVGTLGSHAPSVCLLATDQHQVTRVWDIQPAGSMAFWIISPSNYMCVYEMSSIFCQRGLEIFGTKGNYINIREFI